MAEECITVGQYENALLMDGCELRLNGCLRTLDHIIEVRQNLLGPEFLGKYGATWQEEKLRMP
jgi:hypothetical protein